MKSCHRPQIERVFSFTDSDLGWATPDETRILDTPSSDTNITYDRSHDPPFTAPSEELCLSYVINDQHNTSRSNCVRHT